MEHRENPETPREEALDRREAALQLRERQLTAREELRRLKLPESLNEHLDLQSEEGFRRSLGLAEQLFALARLQGAENQAPKRYQPSPEAARQLDYQQRAALYQNDPDSYQQTFGGEKTWTSR